MKKLLIILISLFTFNYSFAYDVKVGDRNYDMSKVYYKSLTKALELDSVQSKDFKFVFDTFVNQMSNVNDEKNKNTQKLMFNNTIDMNVKLSKQVLNKVQYKKYLTLLNMTINNRNLNK